MLEGFSLTINVLLILQVRDIIFFMQEKHLMGPFKGFLGSSRLFWPHLNGPEYNQGLFWGRKIKSSSITPSMAPLFHK